MDETNVKSPQKMNKPNAKPSQNVAEITSSAIVHAETDSATATAIAQNKVVLHNNTQEVLDFLQKQQFRRTKTRYIVAISLVAFAIAALIFTTWVLDNLSTTDLTGDDVVSSLPVDRFYFWLSLILTIISIGVGMLLVAFFVKFKREKNKVEKQS